MPRQPIDISLKDGFKAKPANNGGWLLLDDGSRESIVTVLGAFSTPADMVAFIAGELGVTIAIAVEEKTVDLGVDVVRGPDIGFVGWTTCNGMPRFQSIEPVMVRFRDGLESPKTIDEALQMRWSHLGRGDDIVAWKYGEE